MSGGWGGREALVPGVGAVGVGAVDAVASGACPPIFNATKCESSHTASNHATSTAAPITNTRQLGRPRPSENLSDRPLALGAVLRGSRSLTMIATPTITTEPPSIATTQTS